MQKLLLGYCGQHKSRPSGYRETQGAFLMDNGDLLPLAVADVTVDGQRLVGVASGRRSRCRFDPVYAAGRDPQLDYAVEVLSERIKGY
jgi:carboxyl-terminal processing protease